MKGRGMGSLSATVRAGGCGRVASAK